MADKAYITPNVLKWARESAKMPIEVAASKIPHLTVEKLKEWEEGIKRPTIKQAQTLAKVYKRPFALLFLPEIPGDFQPLQDFRVKGAKDLSTSSIFIIREIQQKQSWLKEIFLENNADKLPFVGLFSMKDNPKVIAKNILSTLGIQPAKYATENPIKEWIDAAERRGIFISRTSFINSRLTLDLEELQGFAIADNYAPFIFINSDDWHAPQLFTLVHELAHIWIAESGISNEIEVEFKNIERYHPVELYCNEVAANALMPEKMIIDIGENIYKNYKEVFKVARLFGVSTFALLVRAYSLKLINGTVYYDLKSKAENEFEEYLKREAEKKEKNFLKDKPGGPSYYLLQLNRNGRLFTQTVLDAFRGGFIEPTTASSLLNVRNNKFHKLEAQLY